MRPLDVVRNATYFKDVPIRPLFGNYLKNNLDCKD